LKLEVQSGVAAMGVSGAAQYPVTEVLVSSILVRAIEFPPDLSVAK
jgi:hypothetical protein